MLKTAFVLLVGIAVGAAAAWQFSVRGHAAQPAPTAAAVDVSALAKDVERLKTLTPNLSHVMADVAFQYSNAWFAARQQNWPLATFYLNETRGRIRWFLRINPTAKRQGDGEVVDMASIFEAIDTSSLAAVREAADKKDRAAFESAYKVMLESCYSCHKSVGRLYLRPMVPTAPPQTIINVDPDAAWP